MKSRKSISEIMLIRRIRGFLVLMVLIGAIVWFFTSNIGRDYPRPSSLFYVNDFAGALSEGAADVMLFYGENLYEDTLDEGDGRSQIVLATFLIEDVSEIAEYDRTEIYREWKIGENDMGLLILLFFTESDIEGITTLTMVDQVYYEIGIRMEGYLTTIEVDNAIEETIYTHDDIDVGSVHLYLELCRLVYEKAYPEVFVPMEYDMEAMAEYIETYPEGEASPISDFSMNFITYALSPYASWGSILAYGGLGLMLLIASGGALFNIGGGGSSGGKGGFTRRR